MCGVGVGWGVVSHNLNNQLLSVVCGPQSQAPDFPEAHGCGLECGRPCGGWRTVVGVRVVSSRGLLVAVSGSQPLSGLHCLRLCCRAAR